MATETKRKLYSSPAFLLILSLVAPTSLARAAGTPIELYILDDDASTVVCRYADSIRLDENGTAKFRDSAGAASDGYWSREGTAFRASAETIRLDGTLEGFALHATVVVSSWQGRQTDKCEYRGTRTDGQPWHAR